MRVRLSRQLSLAATVLVMCLSMTLTLAAQTSRQSTKTILQDPPVKSDDQFSHIQLQTANGAATVTFYVEPGMTQHQLTYRADSSITGLTVTFSASTTGGSYLTIGTSTTLGENTIIGSGSYSYFKVQYSGLTGTGNIDADYFGASSLITTPYTPHANDPCQSSGVTKSSVVINLSSATTTELVAVSGTTSVYVCGFSMTLIGATQTIQFKYGTKVTNPCDTGAVTLTGAMGGSTLVATPIFYEPGMTAFKTIAGQEVCITNTGTANVQGVMSYVQQ